MTRQRLVDRASSCLAIASVLMCGAALTSPALANTAESSEPSPVFGPEWIEPGDALGDDLSALALAGLLPPRFRTTYPRTRMEAARALAGLDPSERHRPSARRAVRELAGELRALGAEVAFEEVPAFFEWPMEDGRIRVRPYLRAEAKWKDGRGVSWGENPRVGLDGTAHLDPRWSIHADVFAGRVEDALLFGDALVADTDFVVFLQSAYVGFQSRRVALRFGRTRHAWGPGRRGDLLLSGEARPFDHLEYELPLGRFRFQALTGVLSRPLEKNVALHRLEWNPHPRFQLAVSEGAIFHGSPMQPLYLLGILPYTMVERVQAQDAVPEASFDEVRNNLLVQSDLWWRFRETAALWASFLADDVATETAGMPSRLGFLLGAEHRVVLRDATEWNVGVEAAKVYQYTYSVFYPDADWSHQQDLLGFPEGPDSERFRVFTGWQPGLDWIARAEAIVSRKGEGRLGTPWYPPNDPRSEGNTGAVEWKLSGVVERRVGVEVELRWIPSAAASLTARVLAERVENRDHVRRDWEPEARFDLVVELHR